MKADMLANPLTREKRQSFKKKIGFGALEDCVKGGGKELYKLPSSIPYVFFVLF